MSEPSSRSLEEALEALVWSAGMDDTPLYREIMAIVQPTLDAARAEERRAVLDACENCIDSAVCEGHFSEIKLAVQFAVLRKTLLDNPGKSEERTTEP